MNDKSVAWFEIPATDFDRAVTFYEKLLETRLVREEMGPMQLAVFPHAKPQPSGAVVRTAGYSPSAAGTIVYLNCDDIRPVLARTRAVGGEVLMALTQLPDEVGVFAQIRDSEGNRVGVFSPR